MPIQAQADNSTAVNNAQVGNTRPVFPALAGLAGFVIPAVLCRAYLVKHGMGAAASLQAVIATLALELVWLPLAGAAFMADIGYAIKAVLVSGAALMIAGSGFCFVVGVDPAGFFQAQLIVVAFTCMVLTAGHFPVRLGLRPDFARARTAVLTLLLVSLPLWSMPMLDMLDDSSWRSMLHHLVTWFSPLALIGLPFEGFDLATTGCMYSVMRGPVVPYPPGAWMVIMAYVSLAGLAFAVGSVLKSCFFSPKHLQVRN